MPKKRVGLRTEKSEEARQRTEIIRRNSIKEIQAQDLWRQSTELLRGVVEQLTETQKTLRAAHKVLNKATKLLEKSRREG